MQNNLNKWLMIIYIAQEQVEITKIHRFEFLSENIVRCIFIIGSKITYKGKYNDDLPTVKSIFKK